MGKLWQWVLNIFKSAWFKAFLMFAMGKLKEILEKVGKEAYDKIKAKAEELSSSSMTGAQKAKALADYIRSLVPGMADSAVNYLIETIVQELKDKQLKNKRRA